VIVSPSFTEQLRVGPAVPRFPSNIHGISGFGWGLVRRRFTASSFPVLGLCATSRRLGRVTVLPQLKVDRLCSIVNGTADFDPKPTSNVLPFKNLGMLGAGRISLLN